MELNGNRNKMESLLIDGCAKMGIELAPRVAEKMSDFAFLLIEKNKVMNLTSITDEKDIVIKHFLDSLSVLKFTNFENGSKVVDVGTGAGFPGLPVLIYHQLINVLMIDSTNKKLRFIEEVMQTLSIQNGETLHIRAEEVGTQKEYREKFDLCLSRAVAGFPILANYCLPLVKIGGEFIAYKGPSYEEELKQCDIKSLGGEIIDIKKVKLPFCDITHHLIITKKIRQTTGKNLRKQKNIS